MSHGLLPLPASDKLRAYAVYCEGMQGKLSRCQGWDAQLQRQGFEQSFADGTLFWYRQHGQEVALLSLSRRPYGLHIHLLVVLAPWRRQGMGRRVLDHLHQLSRGRVTLCCLRNDKPVRAFYAEMGYRVAGRDTDFLQLEWPGLQAQPVLGADAGIAYNARPSRETPPCPPSSSYTATPVSTSSTRPPALASTAKATPRA